MHKSNFLYPLLLLLIVPAIFLLNGCSDNEPEDGLIFTNAIIWDGTGSPSHTNSALIIQDGSVVDIISMNDPDFPGNTPQVDLDGGYVIPGLINAHGHVGMADGLQTGPQVHSEENVIEQLQLYAAYGITTVVSLGDEPMETFRVRDRGNFPENQMARLYMSGPVLNPSTPEQAHSDVEELMENNPDWTKIRIDDGLGTQEKMPPEVYSAVIESSHDYEIPLAAHIVQLEDAKGVLNAGADLIGHSVRDKPADNELIDMMLEREICITPTLTREVSAYIYRDRPDFFDDPFFLAKANSDVIDQLLDPEVQERYTGTAPDYYRDALALGKENMMALHNSGVRVVLGTDSGPPARFQGYFEHMEMEMMQEAGMTPAEVLLSATDYAARCMGIDENLGTLEPDKAADFIVLENDPLEDVRNLRELRSVYIQGQEVTDIAN